MTQIKINKMLGSRGGNFITLERITLDKRAPTEIRLAAFLLLTKNMKIIQYKQYIKKLKAII